MNIKDHRRYFTDKIFRRGQMYIKDKRVSKPEHDDNGNYTFSVQGTCLYTVKVHISPEGELSGLSCIEEKIRELQLSKSELADIALGGGTADSSIMRMSAEDILKLLE